MGAYCTEQDALFYGDSQGWPMTDSVEQDLDQVILLVFCHQMAQWAALSMCHSATYKQSDHSCDNTCWGYYALQTCTIFVVYLPSSHCV